MVAAGAITRVGVVEAPAVTNNEPSISRSVPRAQDSLPFVDHVVWVAPALVTVWATIFEDVTNVYSSNELERYR